MIQLRKLVPNVYYEQSRDFQFIGRLYDIVLNSVKTNTDLLYSLPLSDDSDTQLLDLMTLTFGFDSKHNYNIQQLKALCACFAKVIRNKGNIQAIQDACNALVSAEGIKDSVIVDINEDNTAITIFTPQNLSDINLLKDLLNYILPAGLTCKIIRVVKTAEESTTNITFSGAVEYYQMHADNISSIITKVNNAGDIIKNKPKNYNGTFANAVIMQQGNKPESED